MSNALKYTPDGGQIVVTVTSTTTEATICVSDTGVGIPSEALPHLFERFYRVHRDGSQSPSGIGLGLYITKMLVEAMEGEITVTSDLGHGSTFTVRLPIRVEPVVFQHPAPAPGSRGSGALRTDAGGTQDTGEDTSDDLVP